MKNLRLIVSCVALILAAAVAQAHNDEAKEKAKPAEKSCCAEKKEGEKSCCAEGEGKSCCSDEKAEKKDTPKK